MVTFLTKNMAVELTNAHEWIEQ